MVSGRPGGVGVTADLLVLKQLVEQALSQANGSEHAKKWHEVAVLWRFPASVHRCTRGPSGSVTSVVRRWESAIVQALLGPVRAARG